MSAEASNASAAAAVAPVLLPVAPVPLPVAPVPLPAGQPNCLGGLKFAIEAPATEAKAVAKAKAPAKLLKHRGDTDEGDSDHESTVKAPAKLLKRRPRADQLNLGAASNEYKAMKKELDAQAPKDEGDSDHDSEMHTPLVKDESATPNKRKAEVNTEAAPAAKRQRTKKAAVKSEEVVDDREDSVSNEINHDGGHQNGDVDSEAAILDIAGRFPEECKDTVAKINADRFKAGQLSLGAASDEYKATLKKELDEESDEELDEESDEELDEESDEESDEELDLKINAN